MLPRQCAPDPVQDQGLTAPPREGCPVRRLRRLYMCLSSMCPSHLSPLHAILNLFLSPSIHEYRECNSRASRHPLRNARESPLRPDLLDLRLSDPGRCRSSLLEVQEVSSTRLSPAFRFGHSE